MVVDERGSEVIDAIRSAAVREPAPACAISHAVEPGPAAPHPPLSELRLCQLPPVAGDHVDNRFIRLVCTHDRAERDRQSEQARSEAVALVAVCQAADVQMHVTLRSLNRKASEVVNLCAVSLDDGGCVAEQAVVGAWRHGMCVPTPRADLGHRVRPLLGGIPRFTIVISFGQDVEPHREPGRRRGQVPGGGHRWAPTQTVVRSERLAHVGEHARQRTA